VILTVWKLKEPTLVTIGDAVASFLYDPDPTTTGICLSSKSSIQATKKWKLQPAKPWHPKRHFWFRAASIKRWLICNILCVPPSLFPLIYPNPDNLKLCRRHRIRHIPTDPRHERRRNLQHQRPLRPGLRLREREFCRQHRAHRPHCNNPLRQPTAGHPLIPLLNLQWVIYMYVGFI
jgi:hypothetical protein